MKTRHWILILCSFAAIQPVYHSSDDLAYLFNGKSFVDSILRLWNNECAFYHCLKELLAQVKSGNRQIINGTTHCAPLHYTKSDDPELMRYVTEAKWWLLDITIVRRISIFCNGLCKMKGFLAYYMYDMLSLFILLENGTFYNWLVFPFLSFCFTLSINWANLASMKIMLKNKSAGGALYYHRMEIWSDMGVNIVNGIVYLLLRPLKLWFTYCGPFHYDRLIFYLLFEWFFLFNQLMILCLVDDRLKSIAHPFEYHHCNHKKESNKAIKWAMVKSFFISLPLALTKSMHQFSAMYFFGISIATPRIYKHTVAVVTGIYTMSLLIKQVYHSAKLRKLYNEYLLANPETSADEKKRQKRERDKAALIWGTVVLNIITVLIVWTAYGPDALWYVVRVLENYLPSWLVKWFKTYRRIVFDATNSFAIPLKDHLALVNGSAAFIIHLLCCKEYGKCFLKTRLGKALQSCGKKIKGLFCQQNQVGVVQQA